MPEGVGVGAWVGMTFGPERLGLSPAHLASAILDEMEDAAKLAIVAGGVAGANEARGFPGSSRRRRPADEAVGGSVQLFQEADLLAPGPPRCRANLEGLQ